MLQFTTPASLYNGSSGSWTAANITVANGATLALNIGGPSDFTVSQGTALLYNLTNAVNNNGLQAGSSFGIDTNNTGARRTDLLQRPHQQLHRRRRRGRGHRQVRPGPVDSRRSHEQLLRSHDREQRGTGPHGANSGTGAVTVANNIAGGLSVLSIQNSGALGGSSGLAPITLSAAGNLGTRAGGRRQRHRDPRDRRHDRRRPRRKQRRLLLPGGSRQGTIASVPARSIWA